MEVKVLMIVIVILILVCGLLLIWAIIAHLAFLEAKEDGTYWYDCYKQELSDHTRNREKLLKDLEK